MIFYRKTPNSNVTLLNINSRNRFNEQTLLMLTAMRRQAFEMVYMEEAQGGLIKNNFIWVNISRSN